MSWLTAAQAPSPMPGESNKNWQARVKAWNQLQQKRMETGAGGEGGASLGNVFEIGPKTQDRTPEQMERDAARRSAAVPGSDMQTVSPGAIPTYRGGAAPILEAGWRLAGTPAIGAPPPERIAVAEPYKTPVLEMEAMREVERRREIWGPDSFDLPPLGQGIEIVDQRSVGTKVGAALGTLATIPQTLVGDMVTGAGKAAAGAMARAMPGNVLLLAGIAAAVLFVLPKVIGASPQGRVARRVLR